MDSYARLLWWLFGSSSGAGTRARIVLALREQPENALGLARVLQVDYSTVRHHLRILELNRMVESAGPNYGRVYSVTDALEARWDVMEVILERSRRKAR